MRVTIKLEGKPITQKEAKEILGEERFERYKAEAETGFLEDPLELQSYLTAQGVMEFIFN